MSMEYKIRFEGDGVAISRHNDDAQVAERKPDAPVVQSSLQLTHGSRKALQQKNSKAGNGFDANDESGGLDANDESGGFDANDESFLIRRGVDACDESLAVRLERVTITISRPFTSLRSSPTRTQKKIAATNGSSFQIETQEKLNWCWAAVAATLSQYFFPDSPISQCEIAREVLHPQGGDCCGAVSDCDRSAELKDALSAAGALTGQTIHTRKLAGKPITFGAIRKQIDSGHPVGVHIEWYSEQRGHVVIISGYSLDRSGEQWLDIADPYYQDATVPYAQFVSAYLDAGEWRDTYLVEVDRRP